MSTTTANPPAIPPRPSRGQEKASTPMVPPRPTNRRLQRSVSPNPDRFAPSPLNETFLKSPKALQPSALNDHHRDPIQRSTSVELPSLGEEGNEYAGLAEELNSSNEESASPEQTRTVAEDLHLHAPKPSLPAASAKQRVMAVTRTDSERAASFGIGRASSVDESTLVLPSNRSLKKKASTTSQLSTPESHVDDEHGIPEIGLQVPMYKNAGDVQAPSPAPAAAEGTKGKHHARKTSGRGNLPPGSYGLHGHGVAPQDRLEKAYFERHPDLLKKEHVQHHYDRPNDYSMSRDNLDKIVLETASRGSGAASKDYTGTPSDQVGWQALEESTSRIASPSIASPELKPESIHVHEPNHRRSVMFSDTESVNADEDVARPYTAPILADDEVAKDPTAHTHQAAVEPPAFELEESNSRPTSRPASLYKETSFELRSTPLEDVDEYEPLFKDDEKQEEKKPSKEEKPKNKNQRFPSADIWEDAPSSVFYTAEVSTPELFDGQEKQEKPWPAVVPPPREGETPAQAFARHQEELAEKEAHGERNTQKPLWAQHQRHLATETAASRPAMQQRFPSRDVWEDTPDSLKLETTVSTPQQDELPSPSPADNLKPDIPERPQTKSPVTTSAAAAPSEKPAIPGRPKPRQSSSDDNNKPAVPGRPKPQIPARPAKAGPTSGGLEPAEAAAPPPRQKPAVPARPMGSKIAALQAGFMSDLNRRLQLGPQAPPKKDEEGEGEGEEGEQQQQQPAEKKEKVLLSDARKGRARGPQRRAPALVAAAATTAAAAVAPVETKPAAVFGISSAVTFFEIDPEEGTVSVGVVVGEVKPVAAEPEPTAEVEVEVGGGEKKSEEEVRSSPPAPGVVVEKEEEEEEKGVTEPARKEEVSEAEAEEVKPVPEAELEANKSEPEPEAKVTPESEPEPEPEIKSLATNMAGETLVAEEIKQDEEHQEVEGVKVVAN
ncbi:altered inheritance of mitochondria protein 21 [Chaetomidium leptoderma]|uniref:Altered inheritance of mitochondria protein 21 n=1 Tax=Chaetomidium leptoderma TaxID=669021 RepID=A0AAN6VV88_9PEZI|nr:altered inheritance of mitochondria protein 21 [Chaetomidium leptoderma]